MERIIKSTIKDQPSSEQATHTFNQGFVKFDLGNIYLPDLGTVHVKSEYPRLKPKLERKHVERCDLEALCDHLLVWVNANFVTSGREKYYKELASATILFSVYVNPIPELYSIELDLCTRFCFWLWYIDDVIENAIYKKVHFKVLKHGTDQLEWILMGKYDTAERKFEAVPNHPVFGHLFDSLLELHNFCEKTLPGYKNRIKSFTNCLQRYFAAQRWFCIDEIDGRYSEESFRTHRKYLAFFDGVADGVALIHGVTLSDEISNSPTLKRILEVANVFGGFANDLLGMKKEFSNGQKDNLIVFKVLEKKIPLDEAVRQVCELLASELSDYVLLKEVMLKEFDHDDNLVRYLDILDSLIDGHNVIYIESPRHGCALTR